MSQKYFENFSAAITLYSPVGPITIFGNQNYISSLKWQKSSPAESTPLLCEAAMQVSAYFKNELKAFDLPLAPAGTTFHKLVWHEIRNIPFGTTLSYSALSEKLSSGPRAIGGACKKNPIPIIIPCHRVIGKNKHPRGYSGGEGVNTKINLLKLEGLG